MTQPEGCTPAHDVAREASCARAPRMNPVPRGGRCVCGSCPVLPNTISCERGVGPPAFVDFLRGVYAALAVGSIHAGATGRDAAYAYSNLQQLLSATIARGNANTIARHTSD